MNAIIVQDYLSRHAILILSGVGMVLFLMLLCGLALWLRLRKLSRRYQVLIQLAHNPQFAAHLEKAVQGFELIEGRLNALSEGQTRIASLVRRCIRTPMIKRFNAFDDVGSDLSFSMAFLDGEGNGFILTNLYGREESRTYAKKVTAGTAKNRLSEEEDSVLRDARMQV